MGKGERGAVVVSAKNRRCWWSADSNLDSAKAAALEKCKNAGNADCAVFAEDTNIVLSPTIKGSTFELDETLMLATGLLVGAAAYESGKSSYTPPATVAEDLPTSPDRAPAFAPAPTIASISTTSTDAAVATKRTKSQPILAHRCIEMSGDEFDTMQGIRNTCNQTVSFSYCIVTENADGATSCSGGRFGAGTIKPGGTDVISTMGANPGRRTFTFVACANPDPDSVPLLLNVHFDGSRLQFGGCM
jgi:hypothetical protein